VIADGRAVDEPCSRSSALPKLMTMTSPTALRTRSALVLAMLVLPWVAASHAADRPDRDHARLDGDAPAIESVTTIELVTADRPTISSTKRDGLRPIPSLPPAGPALDASSSLAWLAWRSGSIGWTQPLALHLAERGPPPIAGD
jgi:hypothetical protein